MHDTIFEPGTMNDPAPRCFEYEPHPSLYGRCTARVRGRWYHPGIYMGERSCNWYVLVAREDGEWLAPTGERCDLASIHGNGEVRWTVRASEYDLHPGGQGGEHLRAIVALGGLPLLDIERELRRWVKDGTVDREMAVLIDIR